MNNILEKLEEIINTKRNKNEIFKKSKEHFGILQQDKNNFRKVGYILPDGSWLDFSGGRKIKQYAHSKISEIGIIQDDFQSLGAIRVDGNLGVLDIVIDPTIDQFNSIKNFLTLLTSDKLNLTYKSKLSIIEKPSINIEKILLKITPINKTNDSDINDPHYWVVNEPNRFKFETILQQLQQIVDKK